MSDTNSLARSLHDLGLAAWFGGSLMGAIGLNGAAAKISNPRERAKIARQGWKDWAPVNAIAIGAHLAGGAVILGANKSRVVTQSGVKAATSAKTAVTVAAIGATAAAGYFGRQLDQEEANAPVAGATEPSAQTPDAIAKAQQALRPLQWAIPILTGTILVLSARMGEQQRPSEVSSGILRRVLPD